MDWGKAELTDEMVEVPRNWLFLHYYEALSVLFKIENSLRGLVYIVLKNNSGKKWIDISINTDDDSQTTIGSLAKKRLAQSKNYGYLGYPISSPIMHLTSGELVRLIISDPYWPLFKKYFNASRQVVTLKLEEIGAIRNSLAHFRPLTADDVEVVKQNANQVFSIIEATLSNIVRGGQRVPTNSTSEWYIQLRSLGGQNSQIAHKQSIDEQWIRISLQFNCPIIKSPKRPGKYASYTVLNINPVGILRNFKDIKENVTCVLEYVPYTTMRDDFSPSICKDVNFTFSKEVLEEKHAILKKVFENLLAQVDSEADLIGDDNLARGDVVYISRVNAEKKTTKDYEYWLFDSDNLRHPLGEDDPPEYWGSIDMYSPHFVSDAHRFPWSPVAVSKSRFMI